MSQTMVRPVSDNVIPSLNSEEQQFIESVRDFVAKEVLPNTRQWEKDRAFPADIFQKLGEKGMLSLIVPKSMGGTELSCRAYVEMCFELAKGDPALSMNVAAVNALVIGHLVNFASDEQREKYLKPAMEGKLQLAWGLTEPDAGSDARRVKTAATKIEGEEGWYHINGEKMFITNGGRADLIVMVARTSETELSAFLMETDQPGFEVIERINTTGVSASNTVRFKLTDARAWHTPCTFEQAISLLYRGRLGIAAMAAGIAEKALELALEYSQQREQFNRRLCDMQSVQNMLADSGMEVEASKLLLYKGAAMYDRGEDVTLESSYAKLYASETSNRVTNRALQIHGGRGMTYEYLIEKLWRDAKLTEIGEGCSEIQRLVISKQLIKGSRV